MQAYNDIEKAYRYLIFHAAFYPKYLADKNEHQSSIEKALANNKNLKVYIIVADLQPVTEWRYEFAGVLRTEFKDNLDGLKEFVKLNIKSVNALKKKYPNRIFLLKSSCLPLAPMIMADNTLFIGHYAHSDIPAPEGLWIKMECDYLVDLLECRMNGFLLIDNLDEEGKAISRYVDELVYAIKLE